MKTFAVYNFGCRVNAAETNQFAQSLINQGYVPDQNNPNTIFINTCSITKKANKESVGLIRRLQKIFPNSKIIVSGCANLKNISQSDNISILDNQEKEKKLLDLNCTYTHKILDKFSHTNRFLLKVQSGCTAFCTYCTVPYKRFYLWSLPIDTAINTVKKAVQDGYKEVIITGVNLNQYTPGFSNLITALLEQTEISLISFGSIPINCIDENLIKIFKNYPNRIQKFLHIPIQSGSEKILKLMKRNYTKKIILEKFSLLNNLGSSLSFGTDIIVGFPSETDTDFQETYDLSKQIGFTKIHVFKYSPRPGTIARKLFLESEKLSKETVKLRSQKLRNLISQTTLPSHQKPEKRN
ncbi:MAG: MiaB/RimO family radical SAM methylthiotransferase [Candidatus Shapirobacteria bacterium]